MPETVILNGTELEPRPATRAADEDPVVCAPMSEMKKAAGTLNSSRLAGFVVAALAIIVGGVLLLTGVVGNTAIEWTRGDDTFELNTGYPGVLFVLVGGLAVWASTKLGAVLVVKQSSG